jgi:surface protein
MSGMFIEATSFNKDISAWNVSSVTDMSGMFGGAISFNQGISSWDVSAVTDMSEMFSYAILFNQPLNSWDVSSVYKMNSMFDGAILFNQDISSWDISNVNNMENFMLGKTTSDYSYYDDLLNSWSLLTLQYDVILDMGQIEYTSAASTAKSDIISNYNWTINDGGLI